MVRREERGKREGEKTSVFDAEEEKKKKLKRILSKQNKNNDMFASPKDPIFLIGWKKLHVQGCDGGSSSTRRTIYTYIRDTKW